MAAITICSDFGAQKNIHNNKNVYSQYVYTHGPPRWLSGKELLAMREIWVRSLGWEDPLEKEMATQSSILAWRIPCTEEPGGL